MQAAPVVHFLHDEPSDVDSFGPHERIAALISEAICTDPRIRIIGLLGPWGSGKSTAVGFIERALAGRPDVDYRTFTFDAWLNQGDSPRRAFLEALVRFVANNRLTPGKDWAEQLHRITGRLDVTRTVETPLNSALSTLVRLTVPVAALGVGLVIKANGVASLWTGNASTETLFGAGLCLALPAALVVHYLASRPTWRFWTAGFYHPRNWFRRAEAYGTDSLVSLLLFKTNGTRQNKVYRDPTPSSIEFQGIVHDVLAELAKGKKRLLVVIDNLDRLPEDEALGLWAVIRTFFLGERRATGPDRTLADTHATILLPIDEKAVERLYSRNGNEDDARARAESFMDKTFDLTLRLPRPAFLDWQDYVGVQLGLMYPVLPHADTVRIVTRLLDAHFLKDSAPITPRRIKTVLNRIGVAWLQWWREDLSFASIAWYAIDQQAIDSDIMAAVASRAPVGALDEDWARSLAAMHFGVSKTKAMSVLIEGPLRRAIAERDAAAFRDAQELRGFEAVLARVLENMVQQQNAPQRSIVNAALLLVECIGDTDAESAHLWTQLAKAAVESTMWTSFTAEDSEGLVAIAHHVDPRRRHAWLQQLVTQFEPELTSKASAANAPALAALLKTLPKAEDMAQAQPRTFVIPGHADFFVAVLADFVGHPLLGEFRTRASADDLGTVITADFANTGFSGKPADQRIRALVQWNHAVDWDGALGHAENAILRGPGEKAGNALLLFGLLQSTNEQAKESIARLAQQNMLAGCIAEAIRERDPAKTARGLALSIHLSPQYVPHLLTSESPERDWPELIAELRHSLDEFSISETLPTSALAHMATDHPALGPLLGPIIEQRVRERHVYTEPREGLMQAAHALRGTLESTRFEALVVRLAESYEFWEFLGRMGIDENSVAILEVFIGHKGLRERARKTLKDMTSRFSESQWETVLWRDERVIPLLALSDAAPDNTAALKAVLSRALNSPHLSAPDGSPHRWLVLARYLPEPDSSALYATLRDRLLERSPFIPLTAFLSGPPAEHILLQPAFASVPDRVLPLLADELFLRVDNEDVLRHVAADLGHLVRNSGPSTRETLDMALASMEASIDPARSSLGRELRAAWGIHRAKEDG
jgi:hypothetical protein